MFILRKSLLKPPSFPDERSILSRIAVFRETNRFVGFIMNVQQCHLCSWQNPQLPWEMLSIWRRLDPGVSARAGKSPSSPLPLPYPTSFACLPPPVTSVSCWVLVVNGRMFKFCLLLEYYIYIFFACATLALHLA